MRSSILALAAILAALTLPLYAGVRSYSAGVVVSLCETIAVWVVITLYLRPRMAEELKAERLQPENKDELLEVEVCPERRKLQHFAQSAHPPQRPPPRLIREDQDRPIGG